MSKFIRIGDKVINTALVTDMEIGISKITVFLAAPGMNGSTRVLSFEGEQADLLQAWIDGEVGKKAAAERSGDEPPPQQITNSAVGAFRE